MRVEIYSEKHEQEVVALWQLAFPDEPDSNEPFALIQRKLQVQPELFFVAIEEGQVVGTTIAGYDGVRGWLHKVATHPDFLKRGVAKALVEAAEQGLEALGCTKLNLQVRDGNEAAIAAYLAMGYQIEARVSFGKKLK